jgi:hypothetical protein
MYRTMRTYKVIICQISVHCIKAIKDSMTSDILGSMPQTTMYLVLVLSIENTVL